MNVRQLENELWEAADQLRANSRLTAAEYAQPVLGLIFLRHAANRFKEYLPAIEADIPSQVPVAQREALLKLGFQGKAAIYLPAEARFDHIAALPQGAQVGEAIDRAMDAIEADHEVLAGALPRNYQAFEPELLAGLIKIFDRPAVKAATGDVFGRIYEYFLNKFAMTGAQEGGEYFTPPSLVRMIVNVIEPDHGLVLDPACGSAGMFVQTGHFIEDVRHAVANDLVTFHGQEKSDTNTRLARMNMVVHGLDASNIRQGNTFYDQIDHLVGQCDFVMANPPFNVDGVETKRIAPQVDPGGRLPFGLPGTNAKTGAISNANGLWIQYFYAYLSATGRAGFVMASSASDAGNKDRDIREQLVKTGHVDVMVAIGTKFFYTRSLPCTLWFFDKGKPEERVDRVLMLDARNVYHVVSARSHVFTEEQLANLTAIVWLHRGECERFVALVASYLEQVAEWLANLPARVATDSAAIESIAAPLAKFAEAAKLDDLNAGQPEAAWVEQGVLDAFKAELASAQSDGEADAASKAALLASEDLRQAIETTDKTDIAALLAIQSQLDALVAPLKALTKTLEVRHKQWLKLVDTAEKTLRARQCKGYDAKAVRDARRLLLPADEKKNESPSVRDEALEAPRQAVYFIHQAHWLLSRFPEARFANVPGLCRSVTVEEIAANDYSLTPGRYVGVAVGGEEDEEDFLERIREIREEIEALNAQGAQLAESVVENLRALFP